MQLVSSSGNIVPNDAQSVCSGAVQLDRYSFTIWLITEREEQAVV